MFAIIFLVALQIVSNSGETSLTRIQNQLFLFNCPYPINGGVVFANQTQIDGFGVNYNVTRDDSDGSEYHLFVFDCEVTDPDIPLYAVSGTTYTSSTDFFATTVNQLGYIYQVISHTFDVAQHMFTIVGFVFTPANFNVLGFTIDDLSGIALIFLVSIYILIYVVIGIWLYKVISPFSGGGS